jgi:serine/threonine-protein kinase
VDESPYEIRGLAGNSIDWCLEEYRKSGPALDNGLYIPSSAETPGLPTVDRTLRGGCFFFDSWLARSACRHGTIQSMRDLSIGFRLVSPLAP